MDSLIYSQGRLAMMESRLIIITSWAAGYNLFFTSFPISYLALWDKDVTYEWVMNSEDETTYY